MYGCMHMNFVSIQVMVNQMIEVVGWLAVVGFILAITKKIFHKKKTNKNEIILDNKDFDHLGPFSGNFKDKKNE